MHDLASLGYLLLNHRIFVTSLDVCENRAAALQELGYTHRLPLHAPFRSAGYVMPSPPTRFVFPDHQAPTIRLAAAVCRQLDTWLDQGHRVVLHCLGGVGRGGTIGAGYLMHRIPDLDAAEALRLVRMAAQRDGYAFGVPVENERQERFLRDWETHLNKSQ